MDQSKIVTKREEDEREGEKERKKGKRKTNLNDTDRVVITKIGIEDFAEANK